MECYNYSPLIYAYQCQNVAITGEGELKARMDLWRTWFSRPPAHMNSLKWLYELASEGAPVEERQMVNDTSHLRPHFIQLNRCENILLEGVIRNCTVKKGHQLLAIGSEQSGGVENVFLDSCTVADDASMFHLVFIKTNERRGGFVRNIHMSNVTADTLRDGILGIDTDVLYQ